MLRTINSLDQVGPDEQAVYLEAPGGGYVLHPDIVETLDRHEAALSAAQTRTTKAEARLRQAVIDRALDFALTAAEVPPAMRRAVSALIEQQTEFEVVEEPHGPQAYARTAYGNVTVANLVASWLLTPGGEPYRPKVTSPGAGRYSTMMRALQ
jgi:hypothetical protein